MELLAADRTGEPERGPRAVEAGRAETAGVSVGQTRASEAPPGVRVKQSATRRSQTKMDRLLLLSKGCSHIFVGGL